MPVRFLIVTLAAALSLFAGSASADVNFIKEIQPILEKSCLKCHGSENTKGGLRLDSKGALLKGSKKSDNVVVAGKADESILYKLIIAPKTDKDRMPNEGDPLTTAQTQLIKNWINEGAKWPDGLVLKSPEATGTKEDVGLPITDAEKLAVDKLQKQGVLAMRLAQSTNLLRVDFKHQKDAVKDENLVLLKDMANLVELDLSGSKITDKDLVHLKPLTNLARLDLHDTKITDAGLENLKGLQKLSYLNVYLDTEITDKGLEHLKGLANLRKLFVWQTKVTMSGAKMLADTIPQLKVNLGTDEVWKGKPETPPNPGSGSGSGSAPASGSGSAKPAGSGSASGSQSSSGSAKPAGSASSSAKGSSSGSAKPAGSSSAKGSSSGSAKPAGSGSGSGSNKLPK